MFDTLYLSMDANFKLKQKERGFSDPPLANGFAYLVSNKTLLEHLAQCDGSKALKDEVISLFNIHHLLFPDSLQGCHVWLILPCDQ